MAKGMMARFKKQNGSLRKSTREWKSAYRNYAPSVQNTVTVGAGGFLAGTVMSGEFVPSEIAGISTPLVLGGLLASYGIFAGNNNSPSDDPMGKIAVNLGNGMISAWASDYAKEMFSARVQGNQDAKII